MVWRLVTVLWLAVVWVALWGDLSWGNVLGGLLVGSFVLAVSRLPVMPRMRRLAAGPALRYAVVFVGDLVTATAQVARQVWWPAGRLRPAIVAVPLRSGDPDLVSLVANTITLTPGTLTIEADEARRMVWVHVLHLPAEAYGEVVEQVQGLEMLGARVLRIDLGTGSPGRAGGPR